MYEWYVCTLDCPRGSVAAQPPQEQKIQGERFVGLTRQKFVTCNFVICELQNDILGQQPLVPILLLGPSFVKLLFSCPLVN
jgi:hypothetical protein